MTENPPALDLQGASSCIQVISELLAWTSSLVTFIAGQTQGLFYSVKLPVF